MTSTYKYIKHFHVQHFDAEYKYIKQKYFRHLYVEHLLPEYNAPVLEIHNDGSGTQTDPSTWSAEDLSQLASHLAITATELARAARRRPGAPGEEWTDDDDDI